MSETQVYHGLASIQHNDEVSMSTLIIEQAPFAFIPLSILRDKELTPLAGWMLIAFLTDENFDHLCTDFIAGSEWFGTPDDNAEAISLLVKLGYLIPTISCDGDDAYLVKSQRKGAV